MNKSLPLLLCTALLAGIGAACAQNEYADIAHLRSMNASLPGIRPMADGEHYTTLAKNQIIRYSYAQTAEGENLLPATDAKLDIHNYAFAPDGQSILLADGATQIYRHSYTTDYYLASADSITPILTDAAAPRDASFSPDSRMLAYSDKNDLYLYNIADKQTTRITDDGKWNYIINGTTDWVYEEEFGFTQAYAFSPDSRRIAYLRFDESAVPEMQLMRYDGNLYDQAFSFKYPKAGEPNSIVSLWVYDIDNGTTQRIETGAETDQYIPRIGWTPDGKLYFYRLNRLQNHFEVVLYAADGTQRTIYDEQSPRYVERVDDKTVTFVDNDRFIVRQETRTGYMQLYLYSIRDGFVRALTTGNYDVTDPVGTDGKRVWYLSDETSPLRRNLYSVRLDGKDKQRLTTGEGFYSMLPSAGMKYYISVFSNATTPNRIEIRKGDGTFVCTLADSRALCDTMAVRPHKEFFSFVTEHGDTLNCYMVRPRNFDPSKKYPVLLTQYSGPGSQSVQDRWAMDWEDALADKGYIVACTDPRGTGFRGEAFKKQTYGEMGKLETEDQISFARYFAAQPYVDSARIGIYGWSYGGFMALSCAIKGDGLFKMAIAVAPVSSWRYYDSIYTEIYNGLPQSNAAGYDDNSPLTFADKLNDAKTRLLIIHGTADDNVHFQNSMEMCRALNRAHKQYDMMVYPDQNHSMLPDDTFQIRQKMIDYTLKNL